MKNEKMVNSTPPPSFVSSKRLCRFVCLALYAVFALALVGCGGDTPPQQHEPPVVEITRAETVNDTNWTISYDSNSGKTLSISASHSESEKKSKYYNWLAYYHGDNSTYVVHSIELYGTPCGDGWFQIIQTETYKSGWQSYDAEDLAIWQQHYVPNCSLDDNGRLVFYTRITRYDEKLLFSSVTPYLQNTEAVVL